MSIKGNIKNLLGCEPKLGDKVSASDYGFTIQGEVTQEASEDVRLVRIKGVATSYPDWGEVITKQDECVMHVGKCRFL